MKPRIYKRNGTWYLYVVDISGWGRLFTQKSLDECVHKLENLCVQGLLRYPQ